VWRFQRKTLCVGSVRAKLILVLSLVEPKYVALQSNSETASEHIPPQVKIKLLMFHSKQEMENHRGRTPDGIAPCRIEGELDRGARQVPLEIALHINCVVSCPTKNFSPDDYIPLLYIARMSVIRSC
jgi:hypothetical protein